jgi:hypothetical protein
MTRRTFAAIVAGLFLGNFATWANQSVTNAPAPGTISIPFELVHRHIVVKVSVNKSAPLPFVLDTGATQAIVKLDRAKALGLKLGAPVNAGGAGAGRSTGALVQGAQWTMPGIQGFSQPLTLALPLTNLASGLGTDIDGIIGGEFIRQFVVELDYQARRITLHDKARFQYSGTGETLPLVFDRNGHPVVKAEVTPLGGAPIAGSFLLDVGSGGSVVLHTPFVAHHQLPGQDLPTVPVVGGMGAGGEVTGQTGRIAELKIGTFRISRPFAMFSTDRAGAFANPDLAGNIGAQIASRFRMFFDYGRSRLILERSPTFGDPFERAFSGLGVRAEGQDYRTFRIKQVADRSPATEAGLQVEDIITAIDGRQAPDLTLSEVIQMLERPVTYELTIRRGTEVQKVTLTPRKLE